jgi:hypothetical protein
MRKMTLSGNHEEVVHTAVRRVAERPVRIQREFEARLAHRAIRSYEGRKSILRSVEIVDEGFRVLSEFRKDLRARTRAANGGLRVTARALIGIEARSETIVRSSLNDLDVLESHESIREELRCARRAGKGGERLS